VCGAACLRAVPPVDPALPDEVPHAVTVPAGAGYLTPDGAIAIVGYNDMAGILRRMDAAFARSHPGFRFALDLKGTRTAPPALAAGRSALAPMGAEFLPGQLAAYVRIAGAPPLGFRVAHAALNPRAKSGPIGIFVARGNPLDRLTTAQVARIFAAGADAITVWGQLGLGGEWAARPIHPYGLPATAALGDFMSRRHFAGRPFVAGFKALPESADVVARIGRDPLGLGFAALNRGTPEVRALAIAPEPGGRYSQASAADLQAGRYPYDRFLYLYARQPLDPFVKEYLRLVLSREGQAIIASAPPGYLPLSAADAARERARLE
jgi:phosphate transport system substrate-binding protein